MTETNGLFYGDNLEVLREHIEGQSVDLIYLDPPFNSNARYNVLFKTPAGEAAEAQAEAFHDLWHWSESAERAFAYVMGSGSSAAPFLSGIRGFLGQSDMMAYLAMMTARLIELHRCLKPTGSLYLHCDPTASHYLKIILDGIFGGDNFRNEIVWKRSSAHSDTKQGRKQYGRVHDVILFYTKSDKWFWEPQYTPYDREYVDGFYRYIEPETGRRYRLGDLTGPGGAAKGNPRYEVMGITRYWRYSKGKMDDLIAEGRIVQTRPGAVPAYKRYLDEMPGVPLQDIWTDINPVGPQARERLGYPTQKPLSLLERIVSVSSAPGDVVLDPFCGCGTTVHAAHNLGRRWIGIDITHYAITVVENRLKKKFSDLGDVPVWGRPRDMDGARDLAQRDKYQFQWWANWLVGVQNYHDRKKGADRGIDGTIFFRNGPWGTGRTIVSVKGGENVGVSMVRDLRGTLERENAELGLLVTLAEPTRNMVSEAAAAGFKDTAHGQFPRVQIMTIEDLFARKPDLPPPYEIQPEDRLPRRKSKSGREPQLEFMFGLTGGGKKKSEVVYPDPRIGLASG